MVHRLFLCAPYPYRFRTAYAAIVLKARSFHRLGIFGYTYGSLLGVFLVGLLTRRRGSEVGNLIAMVAGFIVVALLSGCTTTCGHSCSGGGRACRSVETGVLPKIEFPWRVRLRRGRDLLRGPLLPHPGGASAVGDEHVARMKDDRIVTLTHPKTGWGKDEGIHCQGREPWSHSRGRGTVKIFWGKRQSFCVTIPPFFLEAKGGKNYSGAACGT